MFLFFKNLGAQYLIIKTLKRKLGRHQQQNFPTYLLIRITWEIQEKRLGASPRPGVSAFGDLPRWLSWPAGLETTLCGSS